MAVLHIALLRQHTNGPLLSRFISLRLLFFVKSMLCLSQKCL